MKILVQIIDTLFPPRPTQLAVRTATEAAIKNLYHLQYVKDTVSLSHYQDPLVKALITENKFFAHAKARQHLATLLTLWLNSQSTPLILIPIPLSAKRERERGYNQVTVVLNSLSLPSTIRIDTKLLTRTKHTTAQTSLQRTERLQNLAEAFSCNVALLQTYEHCTIVLVDDVLTTGATMAAASAVLKPHLNQTAHIQCLALAH